MSYLSFLNFSVRIIISLILPLSLISCNQEDDKVIVPNIILIMADDLGWGDVGYQGNDTIVTPNLDQMISEGVQFNRFYSAAPVCSPTRGSCLTGRHPYRYGIYGANVGKMKAKEITLAEALKTVGYTTGHFGKWHLGTLTNDEVDANRGGRDPDVFSPPWEHGFDVCFSTESKVPTYDPMITPGLDAGDIGNRIPGTHFGTYYWTGPGEKVTDNLEGDDSRIIMDRVLPFIQSSVNNNQPFLSVIWFHTPHLPVITGHDYRDLYLGYDEDIQHFYGCITAMDEQIGRLVRELKKLGEWENTIIFFTSDNGPEGKTRSGRMQGSTRGLNSWNYDMA
jgi:arylsulfatase A-like enzyme